MPSRQEVLRELASRGDEMSPAEQEQFNEILQAMPPPSVEDRSLPPKTLGGFASNILPSAGRLATDIGSAIAHPVETAKGVAGLLTRPPMAGPRAGELNPQQEALIEFVRGRYGSPEALGATVYNDPVGFLADVSSVLSGGAGVLKGAASIAPKIGGVSRAAGIASKAARATDPVGTVVRGGVKVAKIPLNIGFKFTGAAIGAATGSGTEAVRIAVVKNTKRFQAAMRGQRSILQVADDVRDAVQELRRKRGAVYREQLKKLKSSKAKIDLAPVRAKIDAKLADFRVKRVKSKSKKAQKQFDFSSSAIGDKAQREIARAVDLIDNWEDTSVLGVDALKRRLGDFYSDSGQSRAFVASLEKEVRKTLDGVPGYKKMTSQYAAATGVIDLFDKELSLSQQAGTTVRKLSNALNQNNNFRQVLLEALDDASGTGLIEEIAGSTFQSIAPRGIMRPLIGGSLIYSIGTGALESIPAVTLTSPRAMGELLTAISAVRRGAATIGRTIPGYPGALAYRPLTIDLEDPETKESVLRLPR